MSVSAVAESGSLFDGIDPNAVGEAFETLLAQPGLKVERIVSTGQSSPPGFWYEQGWTEWVLVVAGQAELRFEDEDKPRTLEAGDHLHIAPGRRHRVESTAQERPTIWLAIHCGDLVS